MERGSGGAGVEDLKKVNELALQLNMPDLAKRASENLAKVNAGAAKLVEARNKGQDALRQNPPDWQTAKAALEDAQRMEATTEIAALIRYAEDIGFCVQTKGGIHVKFHSAKGDVDFEPPVMQVTGKVGHARPIQRADFEFLRSVTTRMSAPWARPMPPPRVKPSIRTSTGLR